MSKNSVYLQWRITFIGSRNLSRKKDWCFVIILLGRIFSFLLLNCTDKSLDSAIR